MDIDPEQESCLDLCRDMRRVSEVPTFVFAARKCDRHMVNALDAGTDDNIVKPRALEDILARIRAVLRRNSAESEHPIFVSNNLTIDCGQRTVCVAGKVMRLLLRLLVEYVEQTSESP
jgi:DNA-binding response OmpR family regulator